ncbi:MAG: protein kinase [Verrucomicrobiales bacterium]|nr:protein kinase [Verrucomicrobiales bacterium]
MNAQELAARIGHELGTTPPSTSAPPNLPLPTVADHQLIRRIGGGSYGDVWLARSVTGQWRAVKVVCRARFESDRPFEREFRGVIQFEPISRSHPGLIQVLHVGRDDAVGAFYYVMELADGEDGAPTVPYPPKTGDLTPATYEPRTLRSDLNLRGRLPVAEAVALGVHLAGALGHIHRHGLVHRDVKPSNVIFVQGLPKLADLGLVATTEEARSFVGTEGFIPPEGPGTVKADLFALGRLLYEAVTGKDRCEFPELPPDIDQWPDRGEFLELNEILNRLCAPEPDQRFTNAAEVAGDLNLLLAGRSIRHHYGAERRWRRARQITAIALGLLAIAAAAVWLQRQQQRQAEHRALEERSLRQRAQAAEIEGRQQLFTALLEQARATVRSGELGQRFRALDAVRRAALIRNSPELRREAIAALALPDLNPGRTLPYDSKYTARQLNPSFEHIALCRGRGPVEIRRVADDGLVALLPATTHLPCFNVTWSANGRFVSIKRDHESSSQGADIEVWDLAAQPRLALKVPSAQRNVRDFHPRLPQILTADNQNQIVRWDLIEGAEIERYPLDRSNPEVAIHSPDGSRWAVVHHNTGSSDIAIYDAATGRSLASLSPTNYASTIAWHPDNHRLAITDYAGNVRLWDTRTRSFGFLGRHRAEAVTATFDHSGRYLFTGGWERSLICWDLETFQRAFIVELDGYLLQVRDDGNHCALMTPSGVQLLDFAHPVQRRFPEDLGSRLRIAAFSPDGRWLAAAADERLGVWDLRNPGPAALDDAGSEASLAWTPDANELIGSRRGRVALRWLARESPAAGGRPVLEPVPLRQPQGFTSICLASNRLLWTTTRGSQWVGLDHPEVDEDAWIPTARGISSISPDLRWLGIFQGYTSDLFVYQLPHLSLAAQLKCRAAIAGFQFSPDGAEVGVASRGQIEFWSTKDWQQTRVLTNHAGLPHVGILAQPDRRGWWLAKEQRFACLHDADTLEPLLPLPSSASPLAVSGDGRHLALSVEARRLEVWDLVLVRSYLRNLGMDWSDVPPAPSAP